MVSQPVEGETPVALRAPSVSPSTGDHSEWVDLTRGGPKQTIKVGQIRLSQPCCATNYIRQLDAAILRPGRFDCIIPVGGLDEEGRETILLHFLSRLNTGVVELKRLVKMTCGFTPADIEYLFQQVAQFAFEQELARKEDFQVTTGSFLEIIPRVRPSLTDGVFAEFEKDCATYSRV